MAVNVSRISQLTAKGSNLSATDLVAVSVVDGTSPTGYTTYYVTGQEIINTASGGIGSFSQTADSLTITNTVLENSIVGSGQGSLVFPSGTFAVGDSYHAKIGGVISAQNGDDITIRIKTGATVLATTGAISLTGVTSLGWECELDFTIRSIGASGSIVTNGNFAYNRDSGSLEGFVFQDVQTIDTTVSNTLDITVEWGQAKTQDQIYSSNFVLYKVY